MIVARKLGHRWSRAAALGLMLCGPLVATAGRCETVSAPIILSPYLTNGVVTPGDFRWLRGRFAGASLNDVQVFIAATDFDNACAARSRTDMVAKLKRLGQNFDPGQGAYTRGVECRQFAQPTVPAGVSWETFSAALSRVRPYALGLLRATTIAEQEVIDHGSYADQLRTRPLGEQTLRYLWIESQRHEGLTAGYSPLERAIHEAILLRALDDRDQANTEWLAGFIAKQGWPSRKGVGEDASRAAWLLVQHADANPAFQLTALRLMTPLAATGEIEQQNFAMLTDRVELKLHGKQRYGTQWTCRAGVREPLPLEGSYPATDTVRASVGLDSLSANLKQINELYGACSVQK